jgi:hypothetical protein
MRRWIFPEEIMLPIHLWAGAHLPAHSMSKKDAFFTENKDAFCIFGRG